MDKEDRTQNQNPGNSNVERMRNSAKVTKEIMSRCWEKTSFVYRGSVI